MGFNRILIVGLGTMTGAMVEGWLAAGADPAIFEVYHPSRQEARYGLTLHNHWPKRDYDAILLGVKPHQLGAIAPEMEGLANPQTTILSVLAGVTVDSLAQYFPRAAGCVRFMPNLASAICRSPNALFAGPLGDQCRANVSALAEMIGSAEWIAEEAQFDLVTALTGSGPAFLYRFIDALGAAAADLGLPPEQAQRLATMMVEGAAGLPARSNVSPAELARRVASPGGMTQCGLDRLDHENALKELLQQTLGAARDRGAQLARAAAAD